MITIYGFYHVFAKAIAFRVDLCLACQCEVIAVAVRTFKLFHLFWFPVLPVGVWSRWLCGNCGSPPHWNPHTPRGFKVAGAALLILFTLIFWFAPNEGVGLVILWFGRIALPLGLFFTIRAILSHHHEPDFLLALSRVVSYSGTSCPLCRSLIQDTPEGHRCSSCNALHKPLRTKAT